MLGGIKLRRMAHQIQKYFLGNVLRVLRVFYQTEGGPEHGIAKPLHRRFRGEGRHLGRFHGAGPPFLIQNTTQLALLLHGWFGL